MKIGLVWVGVLALGCIGCGGESIPPTVDADALVGTWAATMRHNGQQASFVVRFAREDAGTLGATVAMPSIGAWSIPFGPAQIQDGTTVRTGPLTFVWNPERGTLEADRLEGVVPVHDIPVVLERSAPIAPQAVPDEVRSPAEPAWVFDTGAPSWSGCVFDSRDRGVAFLGNDAGDVLAVDAERGTLRWRAKTGGAVRARPAVAGDVLLVHSDDGFLYALATASGAVRWKARLNDAAYERIPPGSAGSRYEHFASSATVVDDVIYVGSGDGVLHALDAATGVERWTYRAADSISSTPAVDAGRVFVGSFDGYVHAVGAASGEPLWKYDTGAPVPSSPATAGSSVLVGSRSFDFWSLDATDGTPRWKFYYWFSWVDSDAAVSGDTAYIGSSDALRVYALDVESGGLRWSFDTAGWTWAKPALTRDAVFAATVGVTDYIGERRGGLFALDRGNGTLRWHFAADPVESGMWGFAGAPAVGAGKVFAGSLDGKLYAFAQGG